MRETIRYYAPGCGLTRKRERVPSDIRLALHKAQRGRCYLCGGGFAGRQDERKQATIDHVRPRGKGGPHRRNVVLAHKECNEEKGDRLPYACETLYCSIVHDIVENRK